MSNQNNKVTIIYSFLLKFIERKQYPREIIHFAKNIFLNSLKNIADDSSTKNFQNVSNNSFIATLCNFSAFSQQECEKIVTVISD